MLAGCLPSYGNLHIPQMLLFSVMPESALDPRSVVEVSVSYICYHHSKYCRTSRRTLLHEWVRLHMNRNDSDHIDHADHNDPDRSRSFLENGNQEVRSVCLALE